MFDKLKVPILGLVDNMSFFQGEDKKKYNIFGEGGVEKVANDYKKTFLGKIPISIDLRAAADNGKPLFEENPDHEISKIFGNMANKIIPTSARANYIRIIINYYLIIVSNSHI